MPRLSSFALALLVGCFTLVDTASAQMMASERSQLHQKINNVEVVIDYSRPSVRGRSPIWGGVEPWNILWTPGANSSTTFSFSENVKLNGTDIAAGKYSVWFELLENDPWNLVLFTDTTMFHVPYPSKDSAMVAIEIERKEVDAFVETLRFDIQNIRVDGGIIEFQWAHTVVPIRLDVDPGYDMVFTAEEMVPYTGEWILDQSMNSMTDEEIAEMRENIPEDQLEDFDKWNEMDEARQEVTLEFDLESGHLIGSNRSIAALFPDTPWGDFVLIRKSEGMFVEGGMMDGELMFVNEYSMWEFEFDEDGRAIEWTQRALDDDRLLGRATRAGR